jgi:hypothetical protein
MYSCNSMRCAANRNENPRNKTFLLRQYIGAEIPTFNFSVYFLISLSPNLSYMYLLFPNFTCISLPISISLTLTISLAVSIFLVISLYYTENKQFAEFCLFMGAFIDRPDPRPMTNDIFIMQKNGNRPCPKPLPTFATFPTPLYYS